MPPQAPLPRWRIFAIGLPLATYAIAYVVFFPTTATVIDETAYLRQAAAFCRGEIRAIHDDPSTGAPRSVRVSDYQPGTSALMAPFMFLGGWRSAYILGPLSLVTCIVIVVLWLRANGRSPVFALLVLAYPPMLVISRCAMSDLPSAALTTLGLFIFWHGAGRHWRWWLAAGFLAGASLALRETNALLFALFFLGAILRRESGAWALVAGGLCGSVLRPLGSLLIFGEPFHLHPLYPGFSLGALPRNGPIYLIALTVLVPAGLPLTACYKGTRRPELILTVAAFLVLHLLYDYNGGTSGGLKQWVLGPRFFIPLVPLLAFAMAESVPRLCRDATARWTPVLAMLLAVGVTAEACIVTAVHAKWCRAQREIAASLHRATSPSRPVISNVEATGKFLNELYAPEIGPRTVVDFTQLTDLRLSLILARYPTVDIAIVSRGDSELWLKMAATNRARVDHLRLRFDVTLMAANMISSGERIEFYQVREKPTN